MSTSADAVFGPNLVSCKAINCRWWSAISSDSTICFLPQAHSSSLRQMLVAVLSLEKLVCQDLLQCLCTKVAMKWLLSKICWQLPWQCKAGGGVDYKRQVVIAKLHLETSSWTSSDQLSTARRWCDWAQIAGGRQSRGERQSPGQEPNSSQWKRPSGGTQQKCPETFWFKIAMIQKCPWLKIATKQMGN